MRPYKTINSFTQRPSCAQVVSYLLFLMQILIFSIIIQQRYQSSGAKVGMVVAYSLVLGAQIILTIVASLSDPSDSFMIKYRNQRDSIKNSEIGHMLYCDICRSYVQLTSRHCRSCGRCVENFDHHCMWINNCVGGKNYRIFLAMVALTFLSMAAYITSIALLWAEHGYQQFLAEMGVVWATGLIVLLFAILILNLILLHVYLNYLGLTTYQFIMKQKQQKEAARSQELTQETLQVAKEKELDRAREMVEIAPDLKHKKVSSSEQILIAGSNLKNESQSEASEKKMDQGKGTESRGQKIYPDGEDRHDEDERISNASGRESLRISSFFARNKSLAILVNSEAIVPAKGRQQTFPKTCKNSRQLERSRK